MSDPRLALALLAACTGSEEAAPPDLLVTGHTRVHAFHSPDGARWTRQEEPVAEGWQSLGLHVLEDGRLALTGLALTGRASWWERNVSGPPVRGLVSADGRTWEAAEWSWSDPGAGAPQAIDPQYLGEQLWYVHHEGEGDPVAAGRDNALRVTPPGVTVLSATGLADPSPVRLGNELLVFVTAHPHAVQGYRLAEPGGAGGEAERIFNAGGVTVPYALVVGEELWLFAQQARGGQRRPVLARSRDGRSFSAFAPVDLGPDAPRHCTSPVAGPVPDAAGGGLVLLCVEETRPPGGGGGGAEAGRPGEAP